MTTLIEVAHFKQDGSNTVYESNLDFLVSEVLGEFIEDFYGYTPYSEGAFIPLLLISGAESSLCLETGDLKFFIEKSDLDGFIDCITAQLTRYVRLRFKDRSFRVLRMEDRNNG